MATLFTVGEMAKLSNISKQTLIFYDRKGVFTPNHVDPDNGYRYYSADQLELLDNILILKEMGLSLEEIKSFMENRSVDLALTLMREQQKKMDQRMERIRKLQKKLEGKIEILESFQKDEKRIVFLTKEKPEYLLLEPVKGTGDLLEQDLAQKRLLCRAKQQNYPYYYQIGAMYSRENLKAGQWQRASYMFLLLENPVEDPLYLEKPPGCYARGYHTGPYQSSHDTCRRVWEAVREKNGQPGAYAFEYCILDSLTSRSSRDYVTEIQIPVAQGVPEHTERRERRSVF